jgi:hypothetical protein
MFHRPILPALVVSDQQIANETQGVKKSPQEKCNLGGLVE